MRNILIIAILSLGLPAKAQTKTVINKTTVEARLTAIEDKIAIKNVVDTFSVLADVKDIKTQVLLFTENASVESFRDGKSGGAMVGRKQIGDAFANFLNLFETVYHINGQQTVILEGDKATGISYCTVTLIGIEDDKKMKTTMGVIYHDDFVKERGDGLSIKDSQILPGQKNRK